MKRRKPLRQESKARNAQRAARKKAGVRGIQLHGSVCQLFRLRNCRGPLVPHELVKQSAMKDARLLELNVVGLCVFHNGWVEDNPLDAQCYGVSIPRWYYDMVGSEAFVEASRLRALVMQGLCGRPAWFEDETQP